MLNYVNKKTGCWGKLYGKSSMVLEDPKTGFSLHTGSRAGDSMTYLKELVDTLPAFQEAIKHLNESEDEEDDGI
jgi:hypothetical protein